MAAPCGPASRRITRLNETRLNDARLNEASAHPRIALSAGRCLQA